MSLGLEKRAALPWAGRALEAVPVRPWAALGKRPWGLGELSRTRGAGDKGKLIGDVVLFLCLEGFQAPQNSILSPGLTAGLSLV